MKGASNIHTFTNGAYILITHCTLGKHNTGLCEVCLIEETVEHVMMVCKAYEREQKSLKEELQLLGNQEFAINKILNDGPNAGKKINANMKLVD